MSTYNKIYTDEIYSKVDQRNKDLLSDYELELKVRGRSEATIKQYLSDIKLFYCYAYLNLSNEYILNMKRRQFRSFFLFFQETGKSPARINRQMSSLRGLLQYCEDDDDLYDDYEINVMRKIKSVEKGNGTKEIVFLEDEQITYLIDYLLERKEYQKALYVSLSYDTGGRKQEIYQLTKKSFEGNGYKTEVVRGKRNKYFNLYFSQRTRDIYNMYINDRGKDNIDSLWINSRGSEVRQVTADMLYLYTLSFRSILESKYDTNLPIGPHSFRHSYATNLNNSTHHMLKQLNRDSLDISELKILLHHESVDMSNHYVKNTDQDKLDELFGE